MGHSLFVAFCQNFSFTFRCQQLDFKLNRVTAGDLKGVFPLFRNAIL